MSSGIHPWNEDEDKRMRYLAEVPIVYLIGNPSTGLVKIGRTSNIRQRFQALQAACGSELIFLSYRAAIGRHIDFTLPESALIEQELHKRFAVQRRRGEWFEPSEEMYEAFGMGDDHKEIA